MVGGKLNSIQVLRAFAAICVVVHHAFLTTTILTVPPAGSIVPPMWLVRLGAAGVDVFFVISGFLMAYIAGPYLSGERPVRRFIAQRVIRIWPPYLIVTLFVCAQMLFSGSPSSLFDLQPHRLASLLFVPSFNEQGQLQPIVGPGWTLNYEMLFYLCFAGALWLGRSGTLLKLATTIALLYLVGLLSPPGVVHSFLGDPILFEFVIGAAIGFLIRDGLFMPSHGWAWVAASAALLALFHGLGLGDEQRLVAYGLPAAALLIGAFALDRTTRWPRPAMVLGDASYSIYLIHVVVIARLIDMPLFAAWGFGAFSTLVASLTAIVLSVGAGLVFYVGVEQPLLRWLHRPAQPSRPAAVHPGLA